MATSERADWWDDLLTLILAFLVERRIPLAVFYARMVDEVRRTKLGPFLVAAVASEAAAEGACHDTDDC